MQTSALPDVPRVDPGPAGLEAVAWLFDGSPIEAATPGAAFQAIALSCLHRFELNRDLFARTGEPDALHQTRVALRQLRSAFSIFREIAVDDQFEHLRGELRWLAATTNEVRDLDALAPRMDDVPAALVRARKQASGRAANALSSARAERLLRDLIDWLANGAWLVVRNSKGQTAAGFATASLTKLRRKLARKGKHLRKLDDRALHDVRIAAKKLRYAAWFFSGLFPGEKAEHRAKRFIEAMRDLQDNLGLVQDIAVAPATLKRLRIAEANWPKLPRRAKLVKHAAADFERVLDRTPYWR